jgi:hypothetical protein
MALWKTLTVDRLIIVESERTATSMSRTGDAHLRAGDVRSWPCRDSRSDYESVHHRYPTLAENASVFSTRRSEESRLAGYAEKLSWFETNFVSAAWVAKRRLQKTV